MSFVPRLTGKEAWVVAGTQGATVWVRQWGDKDWWWPLVFVELDTGLLKMDVVGKTQNLHLDDVAQLRINDEPPIDSDNFYDQP